jgi:hypothetical protein
MGHRALVAYGRPDRLYDLRYSHWGGDGLSLVSRITDETPLADGDVEPSLLADSVTRDRILTDFLDPRVYEALYLADLERGIDAYRVCWLEWECAESCGGNRGAIVEVTPGTADRGFLTWFRATKTVLGDVVEMDRLSRRAARSYLEARVCQEYDGVPYTYDGGGER